MAIKTPVCTFGKLMGIATITEIPSSGFSRKPPQHFKRLLEAVWKQTSDSPKMSKKNEKVG
jgi:hypothetical protein